MGASSQTEFDNETLKLTRSIFDTSPDHISIVGTDYRYQRVNPAYERAHGIVQEKIVGLHVADLLNDEVFKNVIKPKLDRCLAGEEIEYQSWIPFKQAGQRFMNIRYIPLRSDGRHVEAVVVQARDLTKQKEANAARATLEYAADHAHEGLALHDTDGIFTYINPAQAHMYGYEVEELLGKSWKELYGDVQRAVIERDHFPVLMREGKWKGELKGKKKNGEQFDVHVSLTLLKTAKGEPEGLLCTCRDITEEKSIEDALRENESQFRHLYESAPVAYFSATLDGHITRVNTKAEELLGYSKQTLIGKSVLSLYAPTEHGQAKAIHIQKRAQAGTEIIGQELEMQKADGSILWVSLTVRLIRDEHGNILERRGAVQDISQRKQQEQELSHKNQRLQLVNEIMTDLQSESSVNVIIQRTLQHVSRCFPQFRVAYSTLSDSEYLTVEQSIEPDGMPSLTGAKANLSLAPQYLKSLLKEEAYIVEDVEKDENLTPLLEQLRSSQTRAMLDLPLTLSHNVVGLLCFDSPRVYAWTSHEIETLKEIADFLTLALKNAQEQQRRESAELQLQTSEQRYRSMVESAPFCIHEIDLNGRIRSMNPAGQKMIGIKNQAEAINRSYLDLVEAHDCERMKLYFSQACLGKTVEFDFQVNNEENVKYYQKTFTPVQSPNGEITTILGIVEDITERQQAEEELKKAHQQLGEQKEHLARLNDSFVQALGEITYDYNHVTDHIQWGGAYRRILGYSPEGMGTNIESWLSRIYPEDASGVVEEFDQAINSKSLFDLEYRFKRRDGSYAWMHDRGVIHRNDAGRAEKIIGIMRDITDRKKSENFLRQQRLILELIATGEPLTTILNELCLACEGQMSGLAASILLLEEDRLRFAGGPTLPEGYSQAIDGLLIGPAAGACGTAVYRKEPVIVTDIAADPLCEQIKEVPLRHGLKACWSVPIPGSDGRILGTFGIYFGEPHSPTEQDLETLHVFIHLAGIAIEGKQAEDELRTANEELEVRVEERTAELTQSNTQLVEEIAERQRSQKQFVNIVKGVAGTTGEKFFPSFVQHLSVALGVDYAFVGQIIMKNEQTVSTIAVFGNGKLLDNFEYGLTHTPCQNVTTRREFCSFPKDANQLFPHDRLLDDLGIEGYAGVPLKDTDGQVIGLMVVLNKEPLTKLHMVESTMKIFAARAAAELERKRSEEALKKSEALAREQLAELNMIYNSAPIGLCLVDKDLRYVRINETLAQMNGVPVADHIGKRFKDVLPDVGHHSNAIAKNIFRTARPAMDVEIQGTTPAHPGEHRRWLANYYPIIDEGEVKAIGGVVQDITERKQREALLQTIQQAESEFIASEDPSKIFDRLLTGVLTITNSTYGFIGEALRTKEGELYLKTHAITNIAWNQETRELYERSAPNLELYNLNTLFGEVLNTGEPVIANDPQNDPRGGGLPKGHPPMHAFLGLPFFQGDRLVGMVGVANRPGGYDMELIAFLQPLLTSCGTLIHEYQIEQRRSQTEQALQESEARLQAILDNSPGLIFLKDLQGRYLHINRKFEQVFQLTRDRVIGKSDRDIFSP